MLSHLLLMLLCHLELDSREKLKICAFEDDYWSVSRLSWLVLLSQQSFGGMGRHVLLFILPQVSIGSESLQNILQLVCLLA
ncbi:hypothetical protein GQ55_5G330300 [Panicum hallii var. hallii]|uniref:Uncharacterized protein n=1 Tax=Panicum hallii var. hallii TaxID=1504633 RepID=A0A2T7DLV8_9POAL|nr:hypothetical protein GQ55_5G330300 [Panicum hallii var. hallii]